MNHAKQALSPGLRWIYFLAFGDRRQRVWRHAPSSLSGNSEAHCAWGGKQPGVKHGRICRLPVGRRAWHHSLCWAYTRFRRRCLRNLSAHCPPCLTEPCALHRLCAKCPDAVWTISAGSVCTIEHAFNPFPLPRSHCIKRCAVAARTTWPVSTTRQFPILRVSKPHSPARAAFWKAGRRTITPARLDFRPRFVLFLGLF